MSKLIYFKRYLYIIDRLRSRPSNFAELQEYVIRKLENEDIDTNFEYAIRTFERDKKDILTLFGISIEYNRKDKAYYIDEEEKNFDMIDWRDFKEQEHKFQHKIYGMIKKVCPDIYDDKLVGLNDDQLITLFFKSKICLYSSSAIPIKILNSSTSIFHF